MQRELILKKIDDYVAGKLTTKEIEDLWLELMKEPEYLRHLETLINVKSLIESRNSVPRQDNANGHSGKPMELGSVWLRLLLSLSVH